MLKLLISGLLLVVAIAVTVELVAVHRLGAGTSATATAHPVVVRKSAHAPMPTKLVRPLPATKGTARRHAGS
ncbi:hypothetical protein MUN81_11330 [Hymenobacter sp. 5317J-9]|uniref:hypothetical protein n=1 Tax=Hymenobacter sp. 5317J-9 TaxID=2932250 RepID=UPI001FD6C8AF|nr:hypothetical protein [Hymenobacter sp. 5317J-9]UOQ95857.1 hypothetical protein MUN81_11330 [Hymenobacter sp. 5317J-9]